MRGWMTRGGRLIDATTFEGTFTSDHGETGRVVRGWWRVAKRAGR